MYLVSNEKRVKEKAESQYLGTAITAQVLAGVAAHPRPEAEASRPKRSNDSKTKSETTIMP